MKSFAAYAASAGSARRSAGSTHTHTPALVRTAAATASCAGGSPDVYVIPRRYRWRMSDARPNAWEQLSQEQQEAFGERRLKTLLDRFESLEGKVDELNVHTTSKLAQDNAASRYFRPMTYELHYLLSSARDHLSLIHTMLRVTQTIAPFAPFTLIRSAIESCAYGLWLQGVERWTSG